MLDPVSAGLIAGGTMGAAAIGKGGSGGGAGSVSMLTGPQKKLLKDLTELLQDQLGQGITPYGGPRVAPIAPMQQQGLDITSGFAPMAGQLTNIAQQGVEGYGTGRPQELGMEALENVLRPWDPARETAMWEEAWKKPALETWEKDIIPAIMEKGVRSAGTSDSGPMRRELARSGETLATNLAGQLSNLLYTGQEAQTNRQLQGIPESYRMGMMPADILKNVLSGAGGFGMQIGSNLMEGGGLQRQVTGEEFGAERAKYEEAQPWANPWVQGYLPQALNTQAVSPYYQQGGPGAGALMMQPLGAMLGSQGFWNMLNPGGSSVATPQMNQTAGMANQWLNQPMWPGMGF